MKCNEFVKSVVFLFLFFSEYITEVYTNKQFEKFE